MQNRQDTLYTFYSLCGKQHIVQTKTHELNCRTVESQLNIYNIELNVLEVMYTRINTKTSQTKPHKD